MTYEPRPGTTAQRVIAHLQLQPPGTELLTSQLGDALGVPPLNIPPCLAPALSAGILRQRKKDGHPRAPAYWSLADHAKANGNAPAARNTPPEGANRDASAGQSHGAEGSESPPGRGTDGAPALGAAPVLSPPPAANGIPLIAFARERAERVADARERRAPTVASHQPTGLRVALWSDGALVIERGPHLVASLTAEETRHLVQYLDKVLLDRPEPATQAA
jgi:hypothetical protein